MKTVLSVVQEFCVHLKSANGPIEVYLCPDNIEADASSDTAITHPVMCTTDGVLPSELSVSCAVGKQEADSPKVLSQNFASS